MPSLSLRRKALDATGQPIDPARLYTPISPHGRGMSVYNPGVELRGAHEAVQLAPSLWITADSSSDEKAAAVAAHRARAVAGIEAPADPSAPRILGPIPPERRRRALRNYHDRAGTIVHEGSVWDVNDEFVKGNPDMFGPDEAA